jgi:hypothetical protein
MPIPIYLESHADELRKQGILSPDEKTIDEKTISERITQSEKLEAIFSIVSQELGNIQASVLSSEYLLDQVGDINFITDLKRLDMGLRKCTNIVSALEKAAVDTEYILKLCQTLSQAPVSTLATERSEELRNTVIEQANQLKDHAQQELTSFIDKLEQIQAKKTELSK